jgi:hypothetical protein
MSSKSPASQFRLKSVALPAEHGGWSFLFEPIALGLLLAPSAAGLFLALAVIGVFLLRHPLKLALVDRRRGRRFARTALAERMALLYSAIAVAGVTASYLTAGTEPFIPLLLAAPLVIVQLVYDAANRSRDWIPEVAGPTALAAVSTSLAMAAGSPLANALPLWAIMAARAVPTVIYVRARLRLEKNQPVRGTPVYLAHGVAILAVSALAIAGLAPALSVVALVLLMLRAIYGLTPRPQPTPARIIGLQELAFGVLTVLLVFAGFTWGI